MTVLQSLRRLLLRRRNGSIASATLLVCCCSTSAQTNWNLMAVARHFPEVSAPHFIIKSPEDVAHMRVVGTYRSARGREGSPNGGDRTLAF